jgi:hypothetical protein
MMKMKCYEEETRSVVGWLYLLKNIIIISREYFLKGRTLLLSAGNTYCRGRTLLF